MCGSTRSSCDDSKNMALSCFETNTSKRKGRSEDLPWGFIRKKSPSSFVHEDRHQVLMRIFVLWLSLSQNCHQVDGEAFDRFTRGKH